VVVMREGMTGEEGKAGRAGRGGDTLRDFLTLEPSPFLRLSADAYIRREGGEIAGSSLALRDVARPYPPCDSAARMLLAGAERALPERARPPAPVFRQIGQFAVIRAGSRGIRDEAERTEDRRLRVSLSLARFRACCVCVCVCVRVARGRLSS